MLFKGLKEFIKVTDKTYLVGILSVLLPFAILFYFGATYNPIFGVISVTWFIITTPFVSIFLPWYEEYKNKQTH